MILQDEISPRQSFAQKVIHIREHFWRSIQKSTFSKKRNTGRRLLKEILASYEQKKKSDAMRLMKQPISLLHWSILTDGI